MKYLELYQIQDDFFLTVLSEDRKPEYSYAMNVPEKGASIFFAYLDSLCMGRDIPREYSLEDRFNADAKNLYNMISTNGTLCMTGDSDKGFDFTSKQFLDNKEFVELFLR